MDWTWRACSNVLRLSWPACSHLLQKFLSGSPLLNRIALGMPYRYLRKCIKSWLLLEQCHVLNQTISLTANDTGNCDGLAIRIPLPTSLDALASAPCVKSSCGVKLSEVQVQLLAEYLTQLIIELGGKMYPYTFCKCNTSLEFPELAICHCIMKMPNLKLVFPYRSLGIFPAVETLISTRLC